MKAMRTAPAPAPARSGRSDMRKWWPVAIWAAMIFLFSTHYFSGAATLRVIGPLLHFLLPGASSATISMLHSLVRKFAHFFEYAILLWLLLRGPMAGRPGMALLLTGVYALLDEGHQALVPGRTASLFDVGIDFSGALFSRFLHAAAFELT